LLDAALETVCAAGARLAGPGEFTLRAFLAGRLDLTQAEAVLGVIDAESHRELDVALAQLAGGLARPLNTLRDQLADLLADVEAGLDFVEEDIRFITPGRLEERLAEAGDAAAGIIEQMCSRTRLSGEARVVLIGWPNVGKSSLLNALAGDSAAIVSPTAGTTRDYVTRRAACDGLHCWLIDTAGVEVRPPNNGVADAAQAMTAEQSRMAHLQLLCLDATRPLNAWEKHQLLHDNGKRLLVLTKIDAGRNTHLDREALETSSLTGQGLTALRTAIAQRIADSFRAEGNVVADTAARCRDSLQSALASLKRARKLAAGRLGEELVAAELRIALDQLGTVVGAVYTEDVLDRIFSRFCIGK
jgi:tRNA modification GTPase